MPHFPARIIKDAGDVGKLDLDVTRVRQASSRRCLLAGGVTKPHGDFRQFHAADGNRSVRQGRVQALACCGPPRGQQVTSIPDGSTKNVDDALRWKQKFNETTDAEMALATQFAFDAKPIIAWADSLESRQVSTLPIHIGIAGPAKLQTLIKFAIACGVGPSLKVLQKRAMDVSKLLAAL